MPFTDKSLAELAELLKGYIRRSGKTQRQVSEEAGVPNPSYLSHMANGRINWVESDYFRPLTVALGLKVSEIAELRPDLIITDETAPAAVDPSAFRIPSALAEAAKKYGGEFARLAWQQHLAELHFRGERPETPDDWYFLYRSLSQLGLGPKGDN